ncbi:cytochrome P450 [Striga asiatica]|uniref:Cytochrome P450 n=1 Tax=Striga asiatica TaxID=4170 RepID=A0A5A7P0R1_STRAF|nr:cytochrome P450 [Striga asiatica]
MFSSADHSFAAARAPSSANKSTFSLQPATPLHRPPHLRSRPTPSRAPVCSSRYPPEKRVAYKIINSGDSGRLWVQDGMRNSEIGCCEVELGIAGAVGIQEQLIWKSFSSEGAPLAAIPIGKLPGNSEIPPFFCSL